MHLYLSSREPWNATYINEEGQAIYKTSTPWTSLGKRVIIDKIALNPSNVELKDHLAEVQYNLLTSSRIKYGGEDLSTSRYFKKTEGQEALGSGRIFTAPDGKKYIWKMGIRVPELVMGDGSDRRVASYHRRRFNDPRPTSLEILPEGEHMVDLILVTFVYVEKLRKNRENQGRYMPEGLAG